jgi:hypothetical protein
MLTEQSNAPNFDYEEDFTNDRLNYEFEALCSEIEPRYLREFFGYDVRKRDLTCFNCLDHRTSSCDRHWEFAQREKGGGVKCVVCSHRYTDAEYNELAEIAAKEFEEEQRRWGPGSIRTDAT